MSDESASTLVQARFMPKAPDIDGVASFSEWSRAGAFTGFDNFMTKRLAENDMTVFCGYDQKNLYLLAVVPLASEENLSVRYRKRDSSVYRDSSIELYLLPGNDQQDIQIIVNAEGYIFDRKGKNNAWNGKWKIAVASKIPQDIAEKCGIWHGWLMEAALPLKEIGIDLEKKSKYYFNFAKNGKENLSFAPVKKSFGEKKYFAEMCFADKNSPGAAFYSLGDPQTGMIKATGRFFNPDIKKHVFSCDIWAIKKGSYIKDVTGFDQVVGQLQEVVKERELDPGQDYDFTYSGELKDNQLDIMQATAVIDPKLRPKNIIYRTTSAIKIKPLMNINMENFPSYSYVKMVADTKKIAGVNSKTEFHAIVKNDSGQIIKKFDVKPERGLIEHIIKGLKPGNYLLQLSVNISRDEKKLFRKNFTIPQKPEWLGNRIGISDKVISPFEPLKYGKQAVSVWGRTYEWVGSVLPSSIISGKHELLAKPATVVVKSKGKIYTAALDEFKFTSKKPGRAEFTVSGHCRPLKIQVKGWIEYDGLCWYEMKILPASGMGYIDIEEMYLEFPLKATEATYYHAAPDRSLNGAVGSKKIELPFQIYNWVGTVERGLGYTTESMENLFLSRGAACYSILKSGNMVSWRIKLVQQPVRKKHLNYAFGIQATPIKPLPTDYHSMLTANYTRNTSSYFIRFSKDCDFTTVWLSNCKFMKAICAPSTANQLLTDAIEFSHSLKVPAIPYIAPDSISDEAAPEHEIFRYEWQRKPERQWKCDTIQTRCCFNSSYLDWMLWTLRNIVRKAKTDGLYFDGGFPQPCSNSEHGCGWKDAKGRSRYYYPVLKMREFKKRIAVMLDQEVSSRSCPSPLFKYRQKNIPEYFFWEHASGAVAPPVHGFNTALFCGEWFKQPIRRGKTYRELLTLDTFRPRYLSQPWGIPNFFLSIASDCSTGKSIQTEAILAYLLPQGGPLYPRYLNKDIIDKVITTMISFNTRAAEFFPAWKKLDQIKLKVASKDVILGVWRHSDGRMLVSVGNCTTKDQEVTIILDKPMKAKVIFPDYVKLPAFAEKLTFSLKRNSFAMIQLEP